MEYVNDFLYFRKFTKGLHLNKNEWCFISLYGIGDTYLLCALSEQMLVHNGGEGVVLMVRESHKGITALFPKTIRRAIIYENLASERIKRVHRFRRGLPFIAHPFFVGGQLTRLLGCNGVSLLDIYRRILNIPLTSTKLLKPDVSFEIKKRAQSRCETLNLPRGRTAVLFPEAVSVNMIDHNFWRELAIKLKEDGWTVCVSVKDPKNLIPNTVQINCPAEEIIPIAEYCGWLITIRSGVCELVSSASCRKTVIYPPQKWYSGTVFSAYNLTNMGFKGIDEFEIKDGNYDSIIRNIVYGEIKCK